jgi:hypothetical protein
MIKSFVRYVAPLVAVGAVIFVYKRIFPDTTGITSGLTLVLVILFSATFAGLVPALLASVVSALCLTSSSSAGGDFPY